MGKDVDDAVERVVGGGPVGGVGRRVVGGAAVVGGSGVGVGFARDIAVGSAGIAQKFEMGEVNSLVASSFKEGMGGLFSREFGDSLGGDAARRLGEGWAEAFLTSFGSRKFGDELFRSLGGLENQSLRSALSHGVAGVLSGDWSRKVSGYVGDAIANAGHQNVSEGFYNLFTTGKFTTSWETGVAGAGAGIVSHLMSANAHLIGGAIRVKLGLGGTDKFTVLPVLSGRVNPQLGTGPGGTGVGVGKSSFLVTPKTYASSTDLSAGPGRVTQSDGYTDSDSDLGSDTETLVGEDLSDKVGIDLMPPPEANLPVPDLSVPNLPVPNLSTDTSFPRPGEGGAGEGALSRLMNLPQVGRLPAPGSDSPAVAASFPADILQDGLDGVPEGVSGEHSVVPPVLPGPRTTGGTTGAVRGGALSGAPAQPLTPPGDSRGTNGSGERVPTVGGTRQADASFVEDGDPVAHASAPTAGPRQHSVDQAFPAHGGHGDHTSEGAGSGNDVVLTHDGPSTSRSPAAADGARGRQWQEFRLQRDERYHDRLRAEESLHRIAGDLPAEVDRSVADFRRKDLFGGRYLPDASAGRPFMEGSYHDHLRGEYEQLLRQVGGDPNSVSTEQLASAHARARAELDRSLVLSAQRARQVEVFDQDFERSVADFRREDLFGGRYLSGDGQQSPLAGTDDRQQSQEQAQVDADRVPHTLADLRARMRSKYLAAVDTAWRTEAPPGDPSVLPRGLDEHVAALRIELADEVGHLSRREREVAHATQAFDEMLDDWQDDLVAGGILDSGAEDRARAEFQQDLRTAHVALAELTGGHQAPDFAARWQKHLSRVTATASLRERLEYAQMRSVRTEETRRVLQEAITRFEDAVTHGGALGEAGRERLVTAWGKAVDKAMDEDWFGHRGLSDFRQPPTAVLLGAGLSYSTSHGRDGAGRGGDGTPSRVPTLSSDSNSPEASVLSASERTRSWQEGLSALEETLPWRLAYEHDLQTVLLHAAADFHAVVGHPDSLSHRYDVDDETVKHLGEEFRTETVARYDDIWARFEHDTTAWLLHEQRHGDAFGQRYSELRDAPLPDGVRSRPAEDEDGDRRAPDDQATGEASTRPEPLLTVSDSVTETLVRDQPYTRTVADGEDRRTVLASPADDARDQALVQVEEPDGPDLATPESERPWMSAGLVNQVNLELRRLNWPHGPVGEEPVRNLGDSLSAALKSGPERAIAFEIAGRLANRGNLPDCVGAPTVGSGSPRATELTRSPRCPRQGYQQASRAVRLLPRPGRCCGCGAVRASRTPSTTGRGTRLCRADLVRQTSRSSMPPCATWSGVPKVRVSYGGSCRRSPGGKRVRPHAVHAGERLTSWRRQSSRNSRGTRPGPRSRWQRCNLLCRRWRASRERSASRPNFMAMRSASREGTWPPIMTPWSRTPTSKSCWTLGWTPFWKSSASPRVCWPGAGRRKGRRCPRSRCLRSRPHEPRQRV